MHCGRTTPISFSSVILCVTLQETCDAPEPAWCAMHVTNAGQSQHDHKLFQLVLETNTCISAAFCESADMSYLLIMCVSACIMCGCP